MFEFMLPLPMNCGKIKIMKRSTKSIHFKMLITSTCHYQSPFLTYDGDPWVASFPGKEKFENPWPTEHVLKVEQCDQGLII